MFGKPLSQCLGFQKVWLALIAAVGILLAIAGFPNIYAAPEYSGPPSPGAPTSGAMLSRT